MKNKILVMCVIAVATFLVPAGAQQKGAWNGDVAIHPSYTNTHKDSKITVGYDGTMYMIHLYNPGASGSFKSYQAYKSTDGGKTWQGLYNNGGGNTIVYTSADICAAGNNAANFRLFIASTVLDTVSNSTGIFLSSFKPPFTAQGFQEHLGYAAPPLSPRGYFSVSLATDSRAPSLAGGYSIAMAAIKGGNTTDSVITWVRRSSDTVFNRRSAYGTTKTLRNVSVALGSAAPSVSTFGRLGFAWDEFNTPLDSFGIIKVMYGYGDNGASVSSGGPYTINASPLYRNPCISLSQVTSGAGSGDIRTLVAYETNNGGDMNIYGRISDSVITGVPNFASNPIIANGAGTQEYPHLMYDPGAGNFLITYHDASTGSLAYKTKGRSTPAASAPLTVKANYRDVATPSSVSIKPRVDINQTLPGAVFVWNDAPATLFDAEYSLPSGISQTSAAIRDLVLFPNPAHEAVSLAFVADEAEEVRYTVSDVTGRSLMASTYTVVRGTNRLSIPLGILPAGTYTVQLQGTTIHAARRFAVR